ncbi:phospholipase A2 heteromtoxin-like [Stegodyphus dumicola]|uniref:phospholipase A2 heteromtoxin-like n=1 Tax=Stegodyphus dumicola TaxID=202533 RepID=UPI0015AF9BAF|nr:phospholipase A2 heteromtoxin-like [Stegodyphus dumicola]
MRFLILLCFVAALIHSQKIHTKKFFLQKTSDNTNEILLIVTWSQNHLKEIPKIISCEVYSDEEIILKEIGNNIVSKPSLEEMTDIREDCAKLLRHNSQMETFRSVFQRFEDFNYSRRRGIPFTNDAEMRISEEAIEKWKSGSHGSWFVFPDTKWCGPGDNAESYNDFGYDEAADKCCRAHDFCDDALLAGETKGNLTNKSSYTSLSCECDAEFYSCLKSVHSVVSDAVGAWYFNNFQRPCYELNYPFSDKCLRTTESGVCEEYERNMTAPMIYQWVLAKPYEKSTNTKYR